MSLNSSNDQSEGANQSNNNGEMRGPGADPHGLGEEVVNEEEARKRREQLNRRPSYRMILKDLETLGDKPMKKEMEDGSPTFSHDQGTSRRDNSQQQRPNNTTLQQLESPGFSQANSSILLSPNAGGLKAPPPAGMGAAGLRVGVVGTATSSQPIAHISPPSQQHLALGQINLIPGAQQGGRLIGAEMPSQPQPQLPNNAVPAPQPLLNAVNNLEMLGLKAPETLTAAFAQNEWQNNLLNSYNRSQLQQQQQLLQQNASVSSPLGGPMNNLQSGPPGVSNLQQQVGPPHGMGNRQGSASLTSFSPRSDNDDNSRKRQVRLLKNREAAKECRRKKKEYVRCLENRVAVLENQNKALIEELKTLKELYCRKEKGGADLQ